MIRLGLIGIRRGGMIRQIVGRGDVTLAGVFDPSLGDVSEVEARERLAAQGLACERAYAQFEGFLAHEMNVVLVASPPAFHASQCIAILRSGRDAISEVPAAMSIEEAIDLVQAVRETGRRYMFAENCCYWGFVQAWRRMLADGRLGTPYYAEGEYIHDIQSLMRQADGSLTWRASFEPIRYCTHETGPLFDMLDDRGARVVAAATPSLVNSEFPAPDAGVALVTTTRGAVVKLLACFKNRATAHHRYLLYGTQGTLETRSNENVTQATFSDIPHLQGAVQLPLGCALAGGAESSGHGGADGAMLNAFMDSIAHDTPPPIDVYRGLDYTLPGICAAMSIARQGAPVEIPDPRQF